MSRSFFLGVTLVLMSCGKTGFEPLDALSSRSAPDGGVQADCIGARNGASECDAEPEPDDDTDDEGTAPVGPVPGDDDEPPDGAGGSTGPGSTPEMGSAGESAGEPSPSGAGGGSTFADAGTQSGDSGSASGGDGSSGATMSSGAGMGGALASGGSASASGGSAADGSVAGGTATGGSASAGASPGGSGSGGTASGGSLSGGSGTGGMAFGGSPSGGASSGGSASGGSPSGGAGGAPSLPGCLTQNYGGHDYLMCGSEVTWLAARDSCASIGMALARVDSAEENQWLFDNAYDLDLPSDAMWIGGSDASVEGEWRWLDGALFWLGDSTGSAQGGSFTNWYNNHPGGNQFNDCVAIDMGADTLPGWYADRCDASSNVYACESL